MTELVDPKEFIITRKRKKYKFALFHNSPLCYEFDEWAKASTVDVVELGAGNAHFLVELATRYPEQSFVAVDVKADRLQSGARAATERGLTNIQFVRARADQVDELFAPASLSAIWLTFSDPFPRRRSAGRRLTHATFLAKYQAVLAPRGHLLIKHDNLEFFQWSLEQLVSRQWCIVELSFDLHESELLDEYKILTTYEERWLDQGLKTRFVKVAYT